MSERLTQTPVLLKTGNSRHGSCGCTWRNLPAICRRPIGCWSAARWSFCTATSQACTAVDDPMTLAAAFDSKELRALRRVGMPLTVTQDPWLRVNAARRADALEAWQTVAAGSTG